MEIYQRRIIARLEEVADRIDPAFLGGVSAAIQNVPAMHTVEVLKLTALDLAEK